MRIVCTPCYWDHNDSVDATYMMVRSDGLDGQQSCDGHAQPLIEQGWAAHPITPTRAAEMGNAISRLAMTRLA